MKENAVSVIMLTLLLIGTLSLALDSKPASANPAVITVPDDYPNIQAAIDAANSGDTIYVRSGRYSPFGIENKSLTLKGENIHTTIVDGSLFGNPAASIYHANNTVITGFALTTTYYTPYICGAVQLEKANNCSIWGNVITAGWVCIWLRNSNNNNFSGNTVTNSVWCGILIGNWLSGAETSSHNVFVGNNITRCGSSSIAMFYSANNTLCMSNITGGYGIQLGYSTNNSISQNNLTNAGGGIYLDHSSDNNTISGNTIVNSGGVAIYDSTKNALTMNNIADSPYDAVFLYSSTHNTISQNSLRNNTRGISFDVSVNNTITQNNITDNECGIYLDASSENMFFHNSFINNTEQAHSTGGGFTNIWDIGYPSGGNYWSDYNGVDLKSGTYQNLTGDDGIGDAPHIVDAYTKDSYPLMIPLYIASPHVPITDPSVQKLPFRLTLSPVQGEWLPYREFALIMEDIAGRSAEFLAGLSPIPYADKVVQVWHFIIADENGDGRISRQELKKIVTDLRDEVADELLKMAMEYSFRLTLLAAQKDASASLDGLTSAAWTGLQNSGPTLFAAGATIIGLLSMPETIGSSIGASIISNIGFSPLGDIWARLGVNLGSSGSKSFLAMCPVDLEVMDSQGRVLNKTQNQIPGGSYFEKDLDGDRDSDALISLPELTVEYSLHVIPKSGTSENDTYTLVLENDGFGLVIEKNSTIANITETGYYVKTYEMAYVHNIAVVGISAGAKSAVGQSCYIQANVTIINNGDFCETFNVTLRFNATIVGTQIIENAPNGTLVTLPFAWNTSQLVKGDYTISSYVTPVQSEIDTADNTYDYGTVLVTIPGDVNGDKIVNSLDLYTLSKSYGAIAANSNWSPNSDINSDFIIDLRDLYVLSEHYGQFW